MSRYELRETRNASAILAATNPGQFQEMIEVLAGFGLSTDDLVNPSGNQSKLAARLNDAFRSRGWREGRVGTRISSELRIMPYAPAGERNTRVIESAVFNEGYKVDNVKGRSRSTWNGMRRMAISTGISGPTGHSTIRA